MTPRPRDATASSIEAVTPGDRLVTGASCALAFIAAGFAGYMVANGPPGTGSDFALIDLARDRANAQREALADPIVTGTAKGDGRGLSGVAVPDGFFAASRRFTYRLASVTGQSASIEIDNGLEKVTVVVREGGLVPGIGPARSVERRGQQWVIVTGALEISERGMTLAR
jgi:hypothetical protein